MAGSILGTRVLRSEDPRLLRGESGYMADIGPAGAVTVTYLRSPFAHAVIRSIDGTAASLGPGVLAVFTADDVDLEPFPSPIPLNDQTMLRPWIAGDRVRYVGEIIAIVVSETPEQGVDATELIDVDFEELEPVIDVEAAATDRLVIHHKSGTNVALRLGTESFDDELFADCELVVSKRLVNNRVAPCPIEGRAAIAVWDGDRLTQWSTTQSAHVVRDGLARIFAIGTDEVRVIVPDVGGSVGTKGGLSPPEVLVAWVARRLGRPARWHEHRSEGMVDLGHGRGQVQYATLGGDRDGTLKALRVEVVQDAGAYPDVGSVLPRMLTIMGAGPYTIPAVEIATRSVVTNTVPMLAYRGAGRPEATAMIERMVDMFAAEADLDPVALRRRNLLPADAFPHSSATGAIYDAGRYEDALDVALETVGIDRVRAEQAERLADGARRVIGVGVSTYVEITNPGVEGDYGAIEISDSGTATVKTGSVGQGHGHGTAYAMVAAEVTGIPFDRIEVIFGDTELVPRGVGTGGSKSAQNGGSAVRLACDGVVELARERAAAALEASVGDIVLDTDRGIFHVIGTPAAGVDWATVAAGPDPLAAEVDYASDGATFPFGTHISVVEVDLETGRVVPIDHVAVDDCGRMIAPLIVEGQVHGGVAQGISQALYEEFVYDGAGNPLTATFLDYPIPAATELPPITRIPHETPTDRNPLGVKGIGEAPTIGSSPAVQNAVVDALSHLGVRHIDMPLTPEKVWRAIEAAGRPYANPETD